MYKAKYWKYKNKYLNEVKQTRQLSDISENVLTDPDMGDGYNTSILDSVSDDELALDRIPEEEIIENINERILMRQNFEGFDNDKTGSTADYMTEDLQQAIVDIGLYGKARARSYPPDEFDDSLFVNLSGKAHKTKILMIDNKDAFDDFTRKYGQMNEKDKRVYINWDSIAKKYRGFYLKSSALGDRDTDIPYMDRETVSNWVYYDFSNVDEVVVFKKLRTLIRAREISRPFKGKAVDEYAVDTDEFSKITDPITGDKILLIDDVKSFDKFTHKYGSVVGKRKTAFIKIDWGKVKRDYDGIYLDKDNDFEPERMKLAYYNDKLYISWLAKETIEPGVVYFFE